MRKLIVRAVLGGIAVAGLAIAAQSGPADAAPAHTAPTAVHMSGCGDWQSAVAGYWKYLTDTSNCGYLTTNSKKNPQHKRYNWAVQAGTDVQICVKVQGHTWSKKQHKTVRRWYSAGCGPSGTALVPWHGQPRKGGGYSGIIAYPKVKALIMPGTLGGAYRWQ